MRRPTARMLPNSVTVQSAGFGRDAAGGRQVALGTASSPLRCSVQPASARDVPLHLRESGIVYHTVYFADDPQLPIRSILNWIDYTPARVLNVSGASRNAAGITSLWAVDCEERS